MTPDERSRKIAAYFEPEPNDWTEHLYMSRGGWWICHNPESNVRKGGYEWRPRTDPEITIRLLKWLMSRGCVVSALGISHAAKHGTFVHHTLAEFEDAIASASLKVMEESNGKD